MNAATLDVIGYARGFSKCRVCGHAWNWKKPHTVYYALGYGAFPVCEDCWTTAPDEDIIEAAGMLADLWVRDNKSCRDDAGAMIAAHAKAAAARHNPRHTGDDLPAWERKRFARRARKRAGGWPAWVRTEFGMVPVRA